MPVAELREGQRVVLDNYGVRYDRHMNSYGLVGVVHRDSRNRFYMITDVYNDHLHTCGGTVAEGHGWYIKPNEVSLLEPEGPYKCRRPKSGYGRFIERIENASI